MMKGCQEGGGFLNLKGCGTKREGELGVDVNERGGDSMCQCKDLGILII